MTNKVICTLALALALGTVLFSVASSTAFSPKVDTRLRQSLDVVQTQRYDAIVDERRLIYTQGLGMGVVAALIIGGIAYHCETSRPAAACWGLLVFFTFTHAHYILRPKTNGYMLTTLSTESQRRLWVQVYRTKGLRKAC